MLWDEKEEQNGEGEGKADIFFTFLYWISSFYSI